MSSTALLVQPFAAWRPRADLAEQVAAPPYDVLNSAEARRLAAGNPDSFLHVSKAEIDLDPALDAHDPQVYRQAAASLRRLQEQGVLVRDGSPHYTLYLLEMDGRRQVGVVAGASVAAYESGRIKRHELTRADKEDDRTRHAETLGAHSGPVFLAHRQEATIDRLVAEGLAAGPPEVDFRAPDGIRHALWVVRDPALGEALTAAFEALPCLYVADGHHRSAAAARIRRARLAAGQAPAGGEAPWERFLAVIFPHDQLRILDYNRVVRDLNGLDEAAFLARVAERFQVRAEADPVKPGREREFGLVLRERGWFRLTLPAERAPADDPVGRLDVQLLATHLLEPILGIGDPRRDTRIDFVGGMRGVTGVTDRLATGEMAAGFLMYPTSMEQLMAVADAGLMMPPKSTWFEPKLRDGLVILPF